MRLHCWHSSKALLNEWIWKELCLMESVDNDFDVRSLKSLDQTYSIKVMIDVKWKCFDWIWFLARPRALDI